MAYRIVEHQDFYEVTDEAGSTVLVADRSDEALKFLKGAVARAAWPDLLAALKEIRTACFHYTGEDQEEYVTAAYEKMEAAIAMVEVL